MLEDAHDHAMGVLKTVSALGRQRLHEANVTKYQIQRLKLFKWEKEVGEISKHLAKVVFDGFNLLEEVSQRYPINLTGLKAIYNNLARLHHYLTKYGLWDEYEQRMYFDLIDAVSREIDAHNPKKRKD